MTITSGQRNIIGLYVLGAVILFLFAVGLSAILPVGVDWEHSYYVSDASEYRDHFKDTVYEGFGWALFFVPHAFLPLKLGNAVNFILHVVVLLMVIRRFGGQTAAILMTFTSPLFFDLARTNNIDWVSLIGFLLPAGWGITFLLTKPQAVGGAALIVWKKHNFHPKYLVPLLVLVPLSFVVFGKWIAELDTQDVRNSAWNFAPFPFMIPLGIYMLYKAWQLDDEIIAAGATPFLVPYVAPYSLCGLLAIVAAKYPRVAFHVYIAFWVYVIVESRRLPILLDGN